MRAYVTPSEELKAIIGKTSRIRKSESGSSTADVEQAAHCAKCQRQPNRERNETARAASADAGRPGVMLRAYERGVNDRPFTVLQEWRCELV